MQPFNPNRYGNTIYSLCLAILVLIFAYSGMIKYTDPNTFSSAMYNQPFSELMTEVLIHVLPATEIITAILLIIQRTRWIGILFALLQMILFTIYTIAVLSGYYPDVPCACGGFIQNLSWPQHLLFNITLLFTCIIAWLLHRSIGSKKIFMNTGQAENLYKNK